LIKVTNKSLLCHLTHREVGPTRLFTSKNLKNDVKPEDVDLYLKKTSWLHRASNNVETFSLPTDAHNVKKHRVIKTF